MRKWIRSGLRGRLLTALLATGPCITLVTPAALAAEPPPVEHFTKWPEVERVVMSPSGKQLALLMYRTNAKYRSLWILDLPVTKDGVRPIVEYDNADITDVEWVNDKRLVYAAFQDGPVVRQGGAATIAIDADRGNQRTLIQWVSHHSETGSNIKTRVLPYGWFLRGPVGDGSDDVLVYRRITDNIDEVTGSTLSRLDTRTGSLRSVSAGAPENVWSWWTDDKGEPLMAQSRAKGRTQVHFKDLKSGTWKVLQDVAYNTDEAHFVPWTVDEEGQPLVLARMGQDNAAVHRYDLVRGAVDPEPMVAIKGFDLAPVAERDTGKRALLGLHTRVDGPISVWFDDKLATLQARIDKALPAGRFNKIECSRCTSSPFLVVRSRSDREPGEYYVYDRQKASLERISRSRPWIDEGRQGQRSFHRIDTRDGLQMPVVVTHPPGAAATDPLPAVVLVHGGPFLRGTDVTWNEHAQFLASRGYRVIEPEFRGSTGYGWKLFRAGWQQWGRSMQDDLVDALDWAAKQKLVDRQRVCIMGGSYGGYAALMGPIRHPDAWKCAVSFAGVTDIETLFTEGTSDRSEESRRFWMPRMVGDPKNDSARWQEVSPVAQAAKIKVPVLLAHGQWDRRVPPAHADDFVSAARRADVKVEYVKYERAGHSWFFADDHTDFLKRVEAFLAKSLKQ
jgi:dipeptidyl aminopeptidase/acylaminoacyl peptidase